MRNNTVRPIGFVGRHLRGHQLENGSWRTAIRVATHSVRVCDGAKKWITTWHDVVAWDKGAEFAARSFVKGSRILVEGKVVYRTYVDGGGHTRYITNIRADELINLDR